MIGTAERQRRRRGIGLAIAPAEKTGDGCAGESNAPRRWQASVVIAVHADNEPSLGIQRPLAHNPSWPIGKRPDASWVQWLPLVPPSACLQSFPWLLRPARHPMATASCICCHRRPPRFPDNRSAFASQQPVQRPGPRETALVFDRSSATTGRVAPRQGHPRPCHAVGLAADPFQ